MDFLILIASLIWIPLIPLRLVLHSGIRLWRRLEGKSFGIVFIYWVLAGIGLIAWRISLTGWRFPTFPGGFTLGLLLVFTALILHTWTIRTLGVSTFLTRPEVTPQKASSMLVVLGPYRYVRHPFYVTEWILLLGLALTTSSWLLLSLLSASLVSTPLVTYFEERELVERFGESYKKYQSEVPRLIPGLRRHLEIPAV